MFLGISIHQNEIIVAVKEHTGEINIVHADGTYQGDTKLKVYVDGNYAYLGLAVEQLLAYDPKLPISEAIGILPEEIQYIDAKGKVWNTEALLALFFKQIKTTLLQDTIGTSNVVVTVAKPLTTIHEKIILKAAAYAEFKSCTVADMSTVIAKAHQSSVKTTKRVLHIHLSETDCQYTLGELYSDAPYIEIKRSTASKNGINTLLTNLQELVQNEYKKITATAVQITATHNEKQRSLAKQLLQDYMTTDQLYLKIRCMFQTPYLELKIQRIKVKALIDDYVTELTASIPELEIIDIMFYSGAVEMAEPLTQYFNQHALETAVHTEYAQTILARGAARMASQLKEQAVPEDSTEIIPQIKEMNINKEFTSAVS